ncbi:hypothetical protein [Anabaena sp. PCC 7108]|uniref:hypothetical protein n=1 Tax=Anabaena sp. PCC 7108 TaxID=163908 RepID=UPI0003449BF0|nr:hypothetical protein [Anabaena sp. PCC 7108]
MFKQQVLHAFKNKLHQSIKTSQQTSQFITNKCWVTLSLTQPTFILRKNNFKIISSSLRLEREIKKIFNFAPKKLITGKMTLSQQINTLTPFVQIPFWSLK